MNRRTLALPAVIGLLAPVLAACGGSGSGSGDKAIVVGTTDRFSASKDVPAPLDPAYAYDAGSWNVLRQTLQTLMVLPRGGGDPVPEAARQCRFTDTGDERYACTLRPGIAFANGAPVTAADVKYSIDRVVRINADSGVSGLLSNIDVVEAQGKDKVVFHLKASDATFPYKLATPAAGIVPPADYPKDRLRTGFKVDGSGPYQFRATTKAGTLTTATFTRNPHYTGGLDPKNDEVDLRSFPGDPDAMDRALQKGGIDLMARTLTPEQIKKYSDRSTGSVDLVESPGLEIRYLAFNTEAAPVKNKAVRQAMAQLVNRGALTSGVYGSSAQPLYSLVPATITGHTNAFFNKYGEPSTAKARTILKSAGVDTPVRLTLHYTTDHYGAGTAKEFRTLRQQLNDSGLFHVDIKGNPWDQFRAHQLKGEYPVYGLGWFPDFPDADNFIDPFLDKGNFLASPYANSTVRNDLIPQSRREADRLNASTSLARIQDIVAADVPVLPLWQGKQYVAARDDVQGAEWALDTSSNLHLWELSRGVSG